jgi:DNA repair protein RecO (recombination protein O)
MSAFGTICNFQFTGLVNLLTGALVLWWLVLWCTGELFEMAIRETEAIVIRVRKWGEENLIVTFYGRSCGKITAIAWRARKQGSPFNVNLELFTYLHLIYHDKEPPRELGVVNQTSVIKPFHELRWNILKLSVASYLTELVDIGVKGKERNESLFKLLLQTLHSLQDDCDTELLISFFELHLLGILGYRLRLDTCTSCQKEFISDYFNTRERLEIDLGCGGIFCHACLKNNGAPISYGTIAVMRYLERTEIRRVRNLRISQAMREELRGALHLYVFHLLGKKPKSADILKKALAEHQSTSHQSTSAPVRSRNSEFRIQKVIRKHGARNLKQ